MLSRNTGRDQFGGDSILGAVMLNPHFAIADVYVQDATVNAVDAIPTVVYQFVMIIMATITLDVPATTISLEIPDELAGEYKITPESVPLLIIEALSAKIAKTPIANGGASARPVYSEIIDFLSYNPTTEQIVAFKISEASQDRLEELLYRKREEESTAEEQAELDTYGHLNHLIIRLKARALGSERLFDRQVLQEEGLYPPEHIR